MDPLSIAIMSVTAVIGFSLMFVAYSKTLVAKAAEHVSDTKLGLLEAKFTHAATEHDNQLKLLKAELDNQSTKIGQLATRVGR